MKRLITSALINWKNKDNRKPLVIFGARQVGKTYSVMEFGKQSYNEVAYFNFEIMSMLKSIFESDLDPIRIVTALTALSGKTISKENTLIFFDEIQAAPKALTALKYFYELAPEYHIIAAGSLLGVATQREELSFPVGKVDEINMFPLTFQEFLMATNNDALIDVIKNAFGENKPMLLPLHEKALELYRTYLIVGGMPDCVNEYIIKKDFDFVKIKQQEIYRDYTSDMTKYATNAESVRHEATFNSIPSQLAKQNKKFQYKLIGENARSRNYEDSIRWLSKASIVLQCYKVNQGKTPIEFYKDNTSYKIYMSDVGLLSSKLMISPSVILSDINFGGEAKGAITENYVAEQLVANGFNLYYWESNSTAELDFILQLNENAIPLECKANNNVRSRSLGVFVSKYNSSYSIRVSTKNFGFENNIKSVPLYAIFCIK